MPSSSDDEPSSVAVDTSVAARDAAAHAGSAVRSFWRSLQHWVEACGRLTQLVIGGAVAMLLEAIAGKTAVVWSFTTDLLPVLSETELLAVLVAVVAGQTVLQRRKFNRLTDVLRGVNDVAADRGRELSRRREVDEFTSSGTIWGLVLSWGVAGAVVGSSYGVGGTVFGAVVGAILADEVAKSDA